MKYCVIIFLLGIASLNLLAQTEVGSNEPSEQYPYGKPHPNAPAELLNYQELIGTCDCISKSRISQEEWAEPVDMEWTFKYIMDGLGIQDETIKDDGAHSGSIRQFIPDSSKWYVHYYSSSGPTPRLSTWTGNRSGNEIILYNPQKAPNGMDGYFKIKFHDISDAGFKWLGTWVTPDESFVYETWKIDCVKRE